MEYDSQTSLSQTPNFQRKRPAWRWLGLSLVMLATLLASYFVIRGTTQHGIAQDVDAGKDRPLPMFVGWKKPDLAIILSGQMQGYLQPCGCSDPQKGGLSRRYNFMQSLKEKGWPVTAIDLGDIAQTTMPQHRLKYIYAMKALKLMDYKAIGIGKNEFLMPLIDALAEYSVNDAQPRPVAANLAGTTTGELFHALNVHQGEIFQASRFKLGVIGVIGDGAAKGILEGLPPKQTEVKFIEKEKVLPHTLEVLTKQKVDISIMLFQGYEKEAMAYAAALHKEHLKNPAIAPVHVLLCLTEDEDPPAFPQKDAGAPSTSILTIGHKGRYVGVIGAWKTATGIELRYQLVSMGPEFETKPGLEKANPVTALMEKYTEDVHASNFLARFPRTKHVVQTTHDDARYVGSDRCATCHQEASNVWTQSKHSHAFSALVNAKNPKLRQFDGECVVCHTVGFKYSTGYNDLPKDGNLEALAKHNQKLQDVGCESCHGPGSSHVNNFNDADIRRLINPYRPTARELDPNSSPEAKKEEYVRRHRRLNDFCQGCHDIENDVHWGKMQFEDRWKLIAHPSPKKGLDAAQASGPSVETILGGQTQTPEKK